MMSEQDLSPQGPSAEILKKFWWITSDNGGVLFKCSICTTFQENHPPIRKDELSETGVEYRGAKIFKKRLSNHEMFNCYHKKRIKAAKVATSKAPVSSRDTRLASTPPKAQESSSISDSPTGHVTKTSQPPLSPTSKRPDHRIEKNGEKEKEKDKDSSHKKKGKDKDDREKREKEREKVKDKGKEKNKDKEKLSEGDKEKSRNISSLEKLTSRSTIVRHREMDKMDKESFLISSSTNIIVPPEAQIVAPTNLLSPPPGIKSLRSSEVKSSTVINNHESNKGRKQNVRNRRSESLHKPTLDTTSIIGSSSSSNSNKKRNRSQEDSESGDSATKSSRPSLPPTSKRPDPGLKKNGEKEKEKEKDKDSSHKKKEKDKKDREKRKEEREKVKDIDKEKNEDRDKLSRRDKEKSSNISSLEKLASRSTIVRHREMDKKDKESFLISSSTNIIVPQAAQIVAPTNLLSQPPGINSLQSSEDKTSKMINKHNSNKGRKQHVRNRSESLVEPALDTASIIGSSSNSNSNKKRNCSQEDSESGDSVTKISRPSLPSTSKKPDPGLEKNGEKEKEKRSSLKKEEKDKEDRKGRKEEMKKGKGKDKENTTIRSSSSPNSNKKRKRSQEDSDSEDSDDYQANKPNPTAHHNKKD